MRYFGLILLLSGVLGFFCTSSRLENLAPLPSDTTLSDTLRQPAGRWAVARWGCAGAAAVGLLLAMFPKGR
jgi:hypothetical protein